MKFTRLFTGPDNQSHFEKKAFELFDITIGKLTAQLPVDGLFFGEITDVDEITWHNTPAPQFIIMLEGSMEIEIGDGSKKVFHTGDILLAEDTTGQGHVTRATSAGRRRYMMIQVAKKAIE